MNYNLNSRGFRQWGADIFRALLLVGLLTECASSTLRAGHIVVVVKPVAPVVFSNGKSSGHGIDLWNEVSREPQSADFQTSSKFRRQMNSALLSVEETDFLEKLDKIYFTPTES